MPLGVKSASVNSTYLHFQKAFPMSSEKALRTRAAIIAAARGIILKEGIGALTMDRAAQAAGMSKGACMYHFKNKRALHAALIEDYAAHLDGQMKRHEALFEGRPDETLVPGFVEWFKTFEADSRDWADVGVALLSNFVHDDELMKPVHEWYQKLWFRIQALPKTSACRALSRSWRLKASSIRVSFGVNPPFADLNARAYAFINESLVGEGAVKGKGRRLECLAKVAVRAGRNCYGQAF